MENEEPRKEVEEFMESSLVIWFKSCLEGISDHELTFEELVDGELIYNVFLKMDIHGQLNDVGPANDDHEQRLKNLETIMRNIRLFYNDDSVILQEPELRLIARAAHSNLQDVKLLLILLLGCAVKCPNKKYFIERFTLLEESTQKEIVSYIRKVTEFPEVVLCRDMLLFDTSDFQHDEYIESYVEQLSFHSQKVYKAFDEIRRINLERTVLIEQVEAAPPPNIPHCVLELNEWKAKAMQLKNIEDEYCQELEKCTEKVQLLERENRKLVSEAKAAKEYRDELDSAMERALQAERLEKEVARYKIKLEKLESMKGRMEELKRDNNFLSKNKDELASQLDAYKANADRMLEIKTRTDKLQEQCEKIALERDSFKEKLAEMSSLNDELERRVNMSISMSGAMHSTHIRGSDESLNTSFDKSLSEQLSRSTNSQLLKLELENRRLGKLVDSLQDMEREKKSLESTNENLTARVKQLEVDLAAAAKDQQNGNKAEANSRVALLESAKKRLQRELEKTQKALNDKCASLEASSKIIKELQTKLKNQEKQHEQENIGDKDANSSILKSPPKSITLQARLNSDLQAMTRERNALKTKVKEAQQQIKKLESWVESLKAQSASPDLLKREIGRLKHDLAALMADYRRVKSTCEELQQREKDDKVEMCAKNMRIIELDVLTTKLNDRCELLNEMHARSETEKRMLMKTLASMVHQNEHLVNRTLEDKNNYIEEEKRNNETVNDLCRAKYRLEDKIMDQYRQMANCRERKKRRSAVNVVKNTFVKVRRAGSEFLNRRRRRSCSDTADASPTEKSADFEYKRASDVNARASAPRNNKSVDFMVDFKPENFSFDGKSSSAKSSPKNKPDC